MNTPVCVLDGHKKIIFYNESWQKVLEQVNEKNKNGRFTTGALVDSFLGSAFNYGLSKNETVIKKNIFDDLLSVNIYPFHLDSYDGFLLFDLREVLKNGPGTAMPLDLISEPESFYERQIPEPVANALLNALDGFHFSLDSKGKIISVSDGIFDKLGYLPSELKGTLFVELISEGSKFNFQNDFKDISGIKTSAKNKNRSIPEVELLKKKGSGNFFDLTLTPVYQDKKLVVAGICLDVQKRKTKEYRLKKAKVKAQSSDRLKSEFLADMSHEIRTPLNGIIGFSSILDREDLDSDKREKYMKIIRSSSRQLLTIVNDIVDIFPFAPSSPSSGQLIFFSLYQTL